MAEYNTEYLKFDAISIKEAIIQKLSEDSDFTDHLFEGSNLLALVDVFSHTFEVLTYYANHGASEAMFTDSQLYENMNRIVKILGYNPFGYQSCKTTVSYQDAEDAPSGTIFNDSSSQKQIPKYAYIDTGITDSEGGQVYYSMINDLFVDSTNAASDVNTFTMVNGRWRLYDTTFTAGGAPFEEYILDLPLLDETDPAYISHPYIDVFVRTYDQTVGAYIYEQYDAITAGTIFGTETSVLSPDARAFELRINENGLYTLKFGDGIHGKKLKEADEVYVIYLHGNGPDGKIGANIINVDGGMFWGVAGLDTNTFMNMIGLEASDTAFLVNETEMDNIHFQNISSSTEFGDMEAVDSIRDNAPVAFRTNNRLMIEEDFEKYMMRSHGSDIYDVKVTNNWVYMADFYRWLWDYDLLKEDIRKNGYEYVDSCDFNNIYIWVKSRSTSLDERLIQEELQTLKLTTAEPKLLEAVDVYFIPCLNFNADDEQPVGYDNLRYSLDDWDPNNENWIEIIKDQNTFISVEKIRSQAYNQIIDFFNPVTNELGGEINFNTLYTNLSSISGVKQVRTAFRAVGAPVSETQYFNGISFANWTPIPIAGKDVDITRGTIQLEDFQFPYLIETNLNDKIKILSESFGQASIEY